jgi:hypothetical protein
MTVTMHPESWTNYDVHGSTLAEVGQYVVSLPEAGQTHWHPTYQVTT